MIRINIRYLAVLAAALAVGCSQNVGGNDDGQKDVVLPHTQVVDVSGSVAAESGTNDAIDVPPAAAGMPTRRLGPSPDPWSGQGEGPSPDPWGQRGGDGTGNGGSSGKGDPSNPHQ